MRTDLVFVITLSILGFLVCHCSGRNAFRAMFPVKYPPMKHNGVDPGQPLFLTPYIKKGQFQKAHQMSQVGPLPGVNIKSYSGFITVNETDNSNMFFWFFPAQENPETAPVLLWLQGGPGGSSLFGLFVEQGPIMVDRNGNFMARNITWNTKFSMLYIDNPVGTGFSFTDKDSGYSTNEDQVATNLYSCLLQFFQVFSEFQKNDFYATGESYAGKYVPAISYKIHTMNPTADQKINFKGMAIGDGLCDPVSMINDYASHMFNVGLLDEKQAMYFLSMTEKAVEDIQNEQWMDAFKIIYNLMLDEHSFFTNTTGQHDHYNFLRTEEPPAFNYYGPVLAEPAVRRAIHVGNLTYNNGDAVEKHLLIDFMQSVKPWIKTIMENYKVLIYNGQLDIIISVPMTEAWIMSVDWSGQAAYKNADRLVWKINPSDTEVAGYVRQVNNFYQVIVRGSGHILPYDQPARGYDMIQRFVENRSFS